jgi:transposase
VTEITEAQYQQIRHCLPRQRGNVSLTNLQVLNAMLYVAEHGCKWHGLPKRFGRWHTIYTRMNRWSKNGVLDSTMVKVHPDGTGALIKDLKPSENPEAVGPPRFIWLPRMLEQP